MKLKHLKEIGLMQIHGLNKVGMLNHNQEYLKMEITLLLHAVIMLLLMFQKLRSFNILKLMEI